MSFSSKVIEAQAAECELHRNMPEPCNADLKAEKSLNAILAMKGGEGDESYAKNSFAQATGFRYVKNVLEHVLDAMGLSSKSVVKIADFGCSSGPNSIEQMEFIVNALTKRYLKCTLTPDFQVMFVDLVSNDFNTLFRLVAERQQTQVQEANESLSSVAYFSTGVAGSFYGRLLPRGSLDVVFSSFALHWLSRIPKEVESPDSPAYNNGFVWIHGGKAEVAQAYARQAQSDLREFLNARKEEMVSGGVMFLLLRGRTNSDPTALYGPSETSLLGAPMEAIFRKLIKQGDLSEKVRDSFNIPIYFRTAEEVKEVIDDMGDFEIKHLELLHDVQCSPFTREELKANLSDCGKRVAQMYRSLVGGLIESHMGATVANKFFDQFEVLAVKRSEREACSDKVAHNPVNLVVLVRK